MTIRFVFFGRNALPLHKNFFGDVLEVENLIAIHHEIPYAGMLMIVINERETTSTFSVNSAKLMGAKPTNARY
ncbi:MAG: hypothetical protein Q9P01_09430 [Anaerolineae bacterium]|nr:hypothetical protein [Anaerolineae bacterium]